MLAPLIDISLYMLCRKSLQVHQQLATEASGKRRYETINDLSVWFVQVHAKFLLNFSCLLFCFYRGDSSDRKAMIQWRQDQQAARQKLEKQKARWHADARKRAKAAEDAKRRVMEEEKRREADRRKVEEAIAA